MNQFICTMRLWFIIPICLLALLSCKRDEPVRDANVKLRFSSDTIFFDTVFTSIGSLTERVKVFNTNDFPIVIDRISLRNGQSSNFKFNADGFSGKSAKEIEIAAEDSIFVFIEVTVDPNGGTSPLVIEDELIFQTSGGTQGVGLVAWGQDAYFYPSVSFGGGAMYELPTDKPHVFYGYSVVDTGSTLTIPCGARIHFHEASGMIVGHEASLKILGCVDDPVIIQGDRLENFFENVPGQWGQIALTQTSKDNEVRNAIIKNGGIGLSVGFTVNLDEFSRPKATLENVQILNMSFIGLVGIDGDIDATNTVVANCGDHTVALAFGGEYNFNHCTFANYWAENPRSQPVLRLSNFSFTEDGTELARPLNSQFTNTIIHGALDEEIEYAESDLEPYNFNFDHCIIRTEEEPESLENYTSVIFDTPDNAAVLPLFENVADNDYSLDTLSKAEDVGITTDVITDLNGDPRDSNPDLGAYEFQK